MSRGGGEISGLSGLQKEQDEIVTGILDIFEPPMLESHILDGKNVIYHPMYV